MGSVPVQRTWVTGEVVSAAEMNSNIRDSVNFLLATPRCQASYTGATYNLPDSSTPSKLGFSTPALTDTDNILQPGFGDRMACNTAGRYEYELIVHFPPFTTNISTIHVGIAKNITVWGTGKFVEDVRQTTGNNNGGFYGSTASCRGDQFMNVGDYATFWVSQAGSGSSFTMPAANTPFNLLGSCRWISSS